jgi:hypothetical protein
LKKDLNFTVDLPGNALDNTNVLDLLDGEVTLKTKDLLGLLNTGNLTKVNIPVG